MPKSPRKTIAQVLLLGCFAVSILAIGIGLGAWISRGINLTWRGEYNIGYADFIGIILSSIGVLLTIVTIFLAVFGVIGWVSISERLRDNTYSFLGEQLSEGKSLYNLIRKEVRDAVYEGVAPVEESAISAQPKTPEEPFEPTA